MTQPHTHGGTDAPECDTCFTRDRADTIRARMSADLTKRLRPVTNQHTLPVILEQVLDDAMFYVEMLLEEEAR